MNEHYTVYDDFANISMTFVSIMIKIGNDTKDRTIESKDHRLVGIDQ